MRPFWPLLVLILLHTIAYNGLVLAKEKNNIQQKTYIVHMQKSTKPDSFENHFNWYESTLKSVSMNSADMIYAFDEVMQGFSARLTPEEAHALQGQLGVLSVQEEKIYKLHTTRTPLFLGLETNEESLPDPKAMTNVIIGLLDSGIWPELENYDDTGLGPLPPNWRGECEEGANFSSSNCNRKLIGARFFYKGYEAFAGPIDESKEYKSPRDSEGHGTHTSTIAAGSPVDNANLFGYAAGRARGMATHARVAMYKVCWLKGCPESDILAAMDSAIQDGVNILSLSIGLVALPYDRDAIAMGAFGAMEKGILVACSAGNYGPDPKSVTNIAPWITTVGAGTLDRDFPAYVSLGNGKTYDGISLHSGKPPLPRSLVPIVYAANVSISPGATWCDDSLIPSKVSGKIVICENGDMSGGDVVVRDAGGVGMIVPTDKDKGEELVASADLIPTAVVGYSAGEAIKEYAISGYNPTATFSYGPTRLNVQPSPKVTALSSRGPNSVTPGILKPDLIAPGVNIIAGWTQKRGPTMLKEDNRRVGFNILSGTSMSCPHVSGLAELLKGAHPGWSPAAIRSALMTTSYTTYRNRKPLQDDFASGKIATPFDYGAGHLNPVSALDPGLVYDTTVEDYLDFLCASNYTSEQIKVVTKMDYVCDSGKTYSVGDLNYPSFAVPLPPISSKGGDGGATTIVKYLRILTNVAEPGTYKVFVYSETSAVKITVEPDSLTFDKPYEKQQYKVTFTASSLPSGTSSFARLVWTNENHTVGSPITFHWGSETEDKRSASYS